MRRIMCKLITRTRVEGCVIVLLSMGYMWETLSFHSSYQMTGVPGPEVFPLLLGSILGFCGVLLVVSSFTRLPEKATLLDGKQEEVLSSVLAAMGRCLIAEWHLLSMWLLIFGYLFLMPTAGFPLSTTLFLTVFFLLLGEKRWGVAITLALAITVLVYIGFATGLEVRLPAGVLSPLIKWLS